MRITALFAALLAPLYILLAVRVILARRTVKVALGDGGDAYLTRRMRVHANFAEYTPYALLLIGLAESLHAAPATLYTLGACLVVGRLSHAYGVSQTAEIYALRRLGVILTIATITAAATTCLLLSLGAW